MTIGMVVVAFLAREGVEVRCVQRRGHRFQHANSPDLGRLLRARGERPRGRRPAEQRDELAAPYDAKGA
jgi:hypothetical protein